MKNKIKNLWVIFQLLFFTWLVCLRSIMKYFFSTPTRPWVDKTIHNWVDQLLRAAQVQYKVINPHHVQPPTGRAIILMCNHTSAFDIPLSFKAFPGHSIRMLAKRELSKIPLFSKGMSAAEFPFIDRKNRRQAIKDLAYAKTLMESGIILWIAPEGTRAKDGQLAAFKKGAFISAIQSKAVIIPLGIKGAFDILPARSMQVNLNQEAELRIGEPIDAAAYRVENRDELMHKTYNSIKQLLG